MPLLRNHSQDFLYNTLKHETNPNLPFQENEYKVAMYLCRKMPYIHTYMHTDMHNSKDRFQKDYIDQKEPDTRDYLLNDCIYMKLNNSQN